MPNEFPPAPRVLHFDADRVATAFSLIDLVDAFEVAHRRPRMEVLDGFLGDESAQYVARSAVDRGRYMATKVFTSVPSNLRDGRLPAVQALCVLFDGRDGRPLATIDGTTVTHRRTAADSALGARYLAPRAPRTLVVVGAGAMAPWLARAHLAVRPTIERVLVWNRTAERAAALAKRLRRESIHAEATTDLEAAVRRADVITACTRSHEPLVRGDWLKPGTHVDLVGGYTPETREADDETVRRARLFVDRRESAFGRVGDIVGPIASGAIGERDVLGDLYDLASGEVAGRSTEDEITVFKNAGGGHLDLMTCELVFERCAGRDGRAAAPGER